MTTYYSDKLLRGQIITASGDLVSWAEAKFIDTTEITTISGDLVSWAEGRFIDTVEMTTISGDIVAQIPSLAGYATESWVGTNYIDNSEMTTISGDIVSHVIGDVVTHSELTTTSGDIISQIPSLTGYATESWVGLNYIDNTEMTTISGDLVAQINSASSSVVTGSGSFAVAGTNITHSLNTYVHATIILPGGLGEFDYDQISSIGTIYVKYGVNVDTVYMTGDSSADGIPFSWFAKRI